MPPMLPMPHLQRPLRPSRVSLHARSPLPSLTAAVLALLLGACSTTGPDYQRPALDLPAAFKPQAAVRDGDKSLLDTAWWSAFGDPQLDELVRAAVVGNSDLRIAALRVEQFDAFLQVSQSAGKPQVGVTAARSRDTLSENRQVPLAIGTRPVDNAYTASGAASWELDLWGKLSRADEAARAELLGSEENRRALVLTVASEVASGYLRLLSFDHELALLQATVSSHRESLKLAQARFDAGGSGELPVIAARAELQRAMAEVPPKQRQIAALENAISRMIGRNPGPVARGRKVHELALPRVPAGLPADLLVQRPDVREAEQQLIAANARIGVARAQYLPSISLTGSSGFASNDLSKLTMLSSNFGSFGVSLLGPIFTSGRIEGQVREAEVQQKIAATAYVRSVQSALRDVEDALTGYRTAAENVALRDELVATLTALRQQTQKRYDGGISNYFDVLEADRRLILGQLQQTESRRDQMASLVSVYKSLGGGWSLPDVTAARTPPAKTDND